MTQKDKTKEELIKEIETLRKRIADLEALDTGHKQAEDEIKKSQHLLAEIGRVGKVGGWEFNIDTKKQTWTEETYAIHEVDLSYEPTVEKGVNFYTPDSRPIIERAVQRAIEFREPFDVELELVTAKGNLRNVHAIGQVDLGCRRVYGFFQDITVRKRAENELRSSQQELQSYVDCAGDAIYVINPEDGRILNCNRQACLDLGYSQKELLQLTTKDIEANLPPDEINRIQHLTVIGKPMLVQGFHKRKDGSTFPAEIRLSLLRFAQPKRLLAIVRNITERQNVEEALRSGKAKLDLALRSARLGVWEIDLVENKRTFDKQTCSLLGLDPAKFGGKPEEFYRAVHPDDRDKIKVSMFQTIDEGVPYEPEYRVVWPDGSVHHIASRGELVRDGTGRPKMINGVIFDITEQKRMTEALQSSKEYLAKIIDSVADPIFVKDREHRFALCNKAFCEFMGHTMKELRGKSDYEFFPKEEADVFWAKDEEVFLKGVENINEEHFTDGKGVRRTIVTKKTLYNDPMRGDLIVGIIRDITDQKKALEEMGARTKELEVFYKAGIGREERILELKNEIAGLKERMKKGGGK